jgi:hypothetical protein
LRLKSETARALLRTHAASIARGVRSLGLVAAEEVAERAARANWFDLGDMAVRAISRGVVKDLAEDAATTIQNLGDGES